MDAPLGNPPPPPGTSTDRPHPPQCLLISLWLPLAPQMVPGRSSLSRAGSSKPLHVFLWLLVLMAVTLLVVQHAHLRMRLIQLGT